MNRIEEIKNRIVLGDSLEDLQRDYPITRALFERLGGFRPIRAVRINHPFIKRLIGNGIIPDEGMLDREAVIGTLLGDGNIYRSLNSAATHTFSFGHSIDQCSYVKLKYELLRPYVNRIRMYRNPKGFYSLHVILKCVGIFGNLYQLFYTADKPAKSNKQKYLFKRSIVELINPRVFSFWLMDDGKKYGTGKYMFSISIGKQPYYKYEDFFDFVGQLSNKLGFSLRAREEKFSYEITPNIGKAEQIFEKIASYIWPYFAYKFGVSKTECGSSYRTLSWFPEWEEYYACVQDL